MNVGIEELRKSKWFIIHSYVLIMEWITMLIDSNNTQIERPLCFSHVLIWIIIKAFSPFPIGGFHSFGYDHDMNDLHIPLESEYKVMPWTTMSVCFSSFIRVFKDFDENDVLEPWIGRYLSRVLSKKKINHSEIVISLASSLSKQKH